MNDHEIADMPALEARLRAYYASCYGAAPSADVLWRRVAQQLEVDDMQGDTDRSLDVIPSALDVSGAPDLRAPSERAGARKGWVARGTALAAAVLLVALGAAVFHALAPSRNSRTIAPILATPATPVIQQTQPLPSDELLAQTDLSDVQMLSATEGWAVGDHVTTTGVFRSLILHYTGGRWHEDPFVIQGVSLRTVFMDSPTDGWAGGDGMGTTGFLLHYAHGQWSEMASPDDFPVIDIQMLSAEEGWAIEVRPGGVNPPAFYLLHYLHGAWSRVSRGDSHLVALSLLSPSEGWAAGRGAIARLHNGMWSTWAQKAPGDVTALQMVSADDGWLAGVAPNWDAMAANSHLFLMHFDGTNWRNVALPALPGGGASDLSDTFEHFAMVSATEGWAVGSSLGLTSLIFRYYNGVWQLDPFAIHMPLDSISMVSADEGWAVGSLHVHTNGNDNASVLVHYSHGAWSVYKP